MGLLISLMASLINLGVSLVLMRAAKRFNSITLEADARHLMTAVWTTGGVLIGIGLVGLTGFVRLDPLIALAVAVNILFTRYRLLVRSGRRLMDIALPEEETAEVKSILDSCRTQGISYHSLRSRQDSNPRYVGKNARLRGLKLRIRCLATIST